MALELILQISVALYCSLGTMLMGLSEGESMLSVLTMAVAASSVYLTDHKRWFCLNTLVANVAAFAAVVFALSQLRHFGGEALLAAIAHLLTYLQLVLFFQSKTVRHYWLLLTLSLLQVTVAAALNLEFWFGVLLTIYMMVGLLCLSLLFLFRERQRFEPLHRTATGGSRADAGHGWPLAAARSTVKSSVHDDPVYSRLTWSFVGRIASTTVVTLVLTVAVFFLTPRLGAGKWGQPRGLATRVTGFADNVDINSLGELLENPEVVLKYSLYDPDTGEPIQLVDEPLLRGAVLNQYDHGQWRRRGFDDPISFDYLPPTGVRLLRQEIDLKPLRTETLFGVYPWAPVEPRNDMRIRPSNQRLTRVPDALDSRFYYQLYTWGIEQGKLPELVPNYVVRPDQESDRLMHTELTAPKFDQLTSIPMARGLPALPTTLTLADSLVEDLPHQNLSISFRLAAQKRVSDYHDIDPEVILAACHKLESYLRDSGQYKYTLRAKAHDLTLDPVEDFLLNRKEGHCEYFATALAQMLRAKGIPSRVVTGFKGGEWNALGGFYQIRQFHAHSWVEAYVPPGRGARGGYWLTLDATPGRGRDEALASQGPLWPALQQFADFASYIWSSYVLGMDAKQQRDNVYRPLRRIGRQVSSLFVGPDGILTGLNEAWRALWGADWEYFQGHWFSWRSGVAAMLLCLFCWGMTRTVRGGYRMWLRWRMRERRTLEQTDEANVEFYRQLERLLSRHKWIRSGCQTQREFAGQVAVAMAQREANGASMDIPAQLTELFYTVRFGQRALNADQQQGIDAQLATLANTLDGRDGDAE